MKILYFTNHLNGRDGWSRATLNLVEPLSVNGVEIVCIVSTINPNLALRQIKAFRQPLSYFFNPLLILLDFFKIIKIIKEEKPDLIHIMVEPYALFVPILSLFLSCRWVLTVNGTYAILPLKKRSTRWLAKRYYSKVNEIIAISHYTARRLKEMLPQLTEKILVVHCGIKPASLVLPEIKNRSNHIFTATFIGWIKPRKGLLEAVAALGEFFKKYHEDFVFEVIGDYSLEPNYINDVLSLADRYGIKEKINFLGRVDEQEKNGILSTSHLYLMLSRVESDHFEGFGLVYLEANEFGVPSIGPNDSGATEAIKDGFSGYVVDASNASMVAEKIRQVQLGKISSAHCHEWFAEHDAKKKAAEVKLIYDQLLGKSG